MRIALLAGGSRGDVAPLAYLGAELHRRGHGVAMLAPADQVAMPTRLGIVATGAGTPIASVFESLEGKAWLADLSNARAFHDVFRRWVRDYDDVAEAARFVARGADVVVANFYLEAPAAAIAEAQGSALVFAHPAPSRHTPESFTNVTDVPEAPGLGPDPVAFRRAEREFARYSRLDVSALRGSLGLAATERRTSRQADVRDALELQEFSPALVPGLAPWSPRRPLVGQLTPSAEDLEALGEVDRDPELDEWLGAGAPPLFATFGSIPVLTEARIELLRSVAANQGLRLLLHVGASSVTSPPGSAELHVLRRPTDFSALLPRCAAIVHHGGSGTTHTAASAGTPQIVCSLLGDQQLWGQMVVRRGIGCHLRLADLGYEDLARCLEHVMSPVVQKCAATLGVEIKAECLGTSYAADLLERQSFAVQLDKSTGGT